MASQRIDQPGERPGQLGTDDCRPAAGGHGAIGHVAGVCGGLGRSLLDLILPPLCLFCGEAIEGGDLCPVCQRLLAVGWPAQSVVCRFCGLPRPRLDDESLRQPCGQCPSRPFAFDSVTVLGSYRAMLQEAIVATKRAAHASLAEALGQRLAARVAAAADLQPLHAVTFVPCHRWRRMMRGGASGAERMAGALGEVLGLPVRPLLVSCRAVRKQSLLPPDQRSKNVAGAFALRRSRRQRLAQRLSRYLPRCSAGPDRVGGQASAAGQPLADHQPLAGQRLLLVDDVLTTGATATEAASVLKRGGAAVVHLAVVARALP